MKQGDGWWQDYRARHLDPHMPPKETKPAIDHLADHYNATHYPQRPAVATEMDREAGD